MPRCGFADGGQMKEYRITRIIEPDYGCEGVPEDGEKYDEVRLVSDGGGELTLTVSDAYLYGINAYEGSAVLCDGEKIYPKEERK